jgi:NAD(P)-dependent dehydrogenase (short-subunit alcohol dehydrogenase family)
MPNAPRVTSRSTCISPTESDGAVAACDHARVSPRSALVTGGGTGIGLATAVELNRAGLALTIAGRRPDVLADAAAAIAGAGGGLPVHTVVADLGEPDAATATVEDHVAHHGGLDALVAAAGAYEATPLLGLTAALWNTTMDVHVRAVVLAASAAARVMTAAGHGRIVLLSSVNGFHSEPDTMGYSAAKTAIISIARSLAVDLADSGVTANAVAPGWVTTPMTETYLDEATPESLRRLNTLRRAGRPEEIAAVIRWLVLDAPEFLTGATIAVDGGQTALAPLP